MQRMLIALVGGLIAGAVAADTHYVDINNPTPEPPYTNGWTSAANTITAAINHAQTVAGDVVLVNTGEYVLGATIAINKSISLIANSTNREDVVVDGASTYRCFYVSGAIVGRLEGFTIRHGWCNDGGGGIRCLMNTATGYNFTVANCTIVSNFCSGASMMGGGVYMNTNTLMTNCTVRDNLNYKGAGGGIVCVGGAVVRNCVISGNCASNHYAGGVHFATPFYAQLLDSVISNNFSGSYGGGVYADKGLVSNCTIVDNISTQYGGGGITIDQATVADCTIARNNATHPTSGNRRRGLFPRWCRRRTVVVAELCHKR